MKTNEEILVELFKNDMLSELKKNHHKGSILNFCDFNQIITELEYHKAKLFLAIRMKNKGAIKEYLADVANYLLAIGNLFEVYNEETNLDECYELNKDVDLFKKVYVNEQSKNQKNNIIMKVKALRYKDTKEFIHIEHDGEEPMIFTSILPRIQPETADLEVMKELFENNDIYEGLELDFNNVELIEFDLIESGEVGADIRNKLSSPKNLIGLLEVFFKYNVGYTDERRKLVDIIQKEMEQSKKTIDYIADLL